MGRKSDFPGCHGAIKPAYLERLNGSWIETVKEIITGSLQRLWTVNSTWSFFSGSVSHFALQLSLVLAFFTIHKLMQYAIHQSTNLASWKYKWHQILIFLLWWLHGWEKHNVIKILKCDQMRLVLTCQLHSRRYVGINYIKVFRLYSTILVISKFKHLEEEV